MNHLRKTLVLVPCVLLLACGEPASTGAASTSHIPTDVAAGAPPGDRTAERIRRGMAYADFRRSVLDMGWTPIVDAQCKQNVVGDDYAAQCAEGADGCKACEELPELSRCNADGDCEMVFRHVGDENQMTVDTHGDLAARHARGDDATFDVTDWTIVPTPTQ